MRMPSQSTQAPRIDAGTLGAHSTAISHGTMRGIVRQLNRFSRQDLLLGRFELLGPHHRRQGGADASRCAKSAFVTCMHLCV